MAYDAILLSKLSVQSKILCGLMMLQPVVTSMSVVLHHGSTCPLLRVVDGCIPRCRTTSPCHSIATSIVVKCCCSRVFLCKQRYIKCPDLYLLPLPVERSQILTSIHLVSAVSCSTIEFVYYRLFLSIFVDVHNMHLCLGLLFLSELCVH